MQLKLTKLKKYNKVEKYFKIIQRLFRKIFLRFFKFQLEKFFIPINSF